MGSSQQILSIAIDSFTEQILAFPSHRVQAPAETTFIQANHQYKLTQSWLVTEILWTSMVFHLHWTLAYQKRLRVHPLSRSPAAHQLNVATPIFTPAESTENTKASRWNQYKMQLHPTKRREPLTTYRGDSETLRWVQIRHGSPLDPTEHRRWDIRRVKYNIRSLASTAKPRKEVKIK